MNMQEKQETIERNAVFLKITVSKFMSRCSQTNRTGVISREDLLQEVTLCFLAEVERYGEETARKHSRTLFNAMYKAVMGAYPLSVPKRTSGFKKLTKTPLWLDCWEDMGERIRTGDPSTRIIDRISLYERLEELSEGDKQIVRWRLEGLSQREIGKRMGLSDVQMCREMKRIKAEITRAQ